VLNLSESSNPLVINGDDGDSVSLTPTPGASGFWFESGASQYTYSSNGTDLATVMIDSEIMITGLTTPP
jgi:hypothetical protein